MVMAQQMQSRMYQQVRGLLGRGHPYCVSLPHYLWHGKNNLAKVATGIIAGVRPVVIIIVRVFGGEREHIRCSVLPQELQVKG